MLLTGDVHPVPDFDTDGFNPNQLFRAFSDVVEILQLRRCATPTARSGWAAWAFGFSSRPSAGVPIALPP